MAEGLHKAIVSVEDFNRVQELKKERSNIWQDETGKHRSKTRYCSKSTMVKEKNSD